MIKRLWATLLVALLLSTPVFAQPGTTPPGDPQPTPSPVPVQDPATGPGLGKPVNVAPVTLSAEELNALKDAEAEYERFLVAATQHDTRMRAIAKREYDQHTADIAKRYADRIAKTEAARSKHRGDTIALLEKFLINHKNHEQFTPDKMFQLADLYLDQADDEVEVKLAALEQSGQPAPEGGIIADYTKSTTLWEQILTQFPKYRQTPSTMYLLAYYGKGKDERRSLTIFLALACSNRFKWNDPPSKPPTRDEAIKRVEQKTLRDPYNGCEPYKDADAELIRHAWVRGIADYHFTVPGEIDEAIAAYLKVANNVNDSRLYAESLYKLAWSYYKRDRLPDSIKRFDESVVLYDSVVAAGNSPALELRDESIQYIAVAFTDPWEGETDSSPTKAFDRAKDFYKGKENQPHVRDVWVAMGKAFAELQAWDQAVDSYRIAIGPPWELNPKNPQVHQEIVNSFEAKGDKFAADAAAAELATKYAPGTQWYTVNEKDREAMESQRRIAERALYAAARNTHAAGTQARKDYELLPANKRDAQGKADYLALYNKAVELYRQFIQVYAESDYVYEFNYNMGEALYWSERYPEAVVQYKWVRDHRDLGTAFYIDAAKSIVQTYEAEAARQVAAGTIQALKVPTVAELKALPQPFQPQPIPQVYVELQVEYDQYQNIVQDPKSAPVQGINAALISLAYLHMDDAIARFQKVMDKFCGNPEAAKAKDGQLAIFEAQSKFDEIEATNKKFITQKCGDQKSIDLAVAQNRSLNFSRAADLYKNKQFVPAAEAFYRFYKTAPNTDPDLPTALYNSAVSYKLADRPKTAIALFKEFTANPAKNFRQSPYFLDAMRLQAATYQAAFDYTNAVRTYLELHAATKTAKKLGIKAPDPLPGEQPRTLDQIGLDALFNAALASELNRDFKKAIELYTQYQREESDRRKKDRALWSIVGIHRQSGDVNSMGETAQRWRGTYGKDAGNEDDFVQTFYDESQLRKRKGQTAAAKKAGDETIKAWKDKGSTKNSRGAKFAGEWELAGAEEHFNGPWQTVAIKKAAKDLNEAKAQSKVLTDAKKKVEDEYLKLDQYGVAEYSMAAKVRYGEIQVEFGQKAADAPIPVPITKAADAGKPEILEAYEKQRDANIEKFTQEAKGQWTQVVDLAKQGGISNRWVRQAMEDLGKNFPGEFTVLRQELVQGTDAP